MEVYLASTYGFCKGVIYALSLVKKIKEKNKDIPLHLLGNLVHNSSIMDELKNEGFILHEGDYEQIIDEIQNGIIIFSAHGHDPNLEDKIKAKGLSFIDATCPYVKKNMDLIKEDIKNNHDIIYIGVPHHKETEAALSLSKDILFISYLNPNYVKRYLKNPHVYVQTTLGKDELAPIIDKIKELYDHPIMKDDICKATYLRQNALNEVPSTCEAILVIGDKDSSNSRRLYELALKKYPLKKVFFISTLDEINPLDLKNIHSLFITAGASTPPSVIEPIVTYLKSFN